MAPSTEAPPAPASELVGNLVTQFSSALDCYRELVQNAIDAGSQSIEVWLEFIEATDASDGGASTIAIHVDDTGDGMDEAIIDGQLTRLFASSKENDLTKIGKFGIGFVSVFALEPRGVLVRTGRGGEFWEVFFHADRSFSKTRLDTPVEGTQLTLFLEGDDHRYEALVRDSRATLTRWCAHSETEITFEDRSAHRRGAAAAVEVINTPFDIAGDIPTRVTHPGTEIAVAYSADPRYGFYNRGLTLALTAAAEDVLGERAGRYRHVAVKLKSRYLEHTLSRETVLRDAHYERAMQLLDAAARGPLRQGLVDALEALAATPTWGVAELTRYTRLVGHLACEPADSLAELGAAQVLRTVDAGAVSLRAVIEAADEDGRVFLDESPGPLQQELGAQGVPVLLGRVPRRADDGRAGLGAVHRLVVRTLMAATERRWSRRLAGLFAGAGLVTLSDPALEASALVVRPDDVYLPVMIHEAPDPGDAALIAAAAALLDEADAGYRKLLAGHPATPWEAPPLLVVGRRAGAMMARPPRAGSVARPPRRPVAVVNLEHPRFAALRRAWAQGPAAAAWCLAKALLLEDERALDVDLTLATAAVEMLGGD